MMRKSLCFVVAAIFSSSAHGLAPRAPEPTAAVFAHIDERQIANPCLAVSSTIAGNRAQATPLFSPSLATQCLESVPLSVNRSVGYIEYIRPYLQFQSTVAYLKDPPKGYTLPGADIFGGLDKIKANVQGGVYKNQWAFEKDLWTLINILPHDFHLNLPLPLVSVFRFGTYRRLVSVSDDGSSLPVVYFKSDWDKYNKNLPPSPIVKINGEETTSYLEKLSLTMSQFQDADAIYNQMFFSLPQNIQGGANLFYVGAWKLGFGNDTNTYTFGNGSTISAQNAASSTIDFTGITSGSALFQAVEVNPTTDVTTLLSKRDVEVDPLLELEQIQRRQSSGSDEMPGYPAPDFVHPEAPYVAGFFLDGDLAVLTMSAFSSGNDTSTTDQQSMQLVISSFLAKAKTLGSKKLIIDLSANGGGSVFSGYDAFKQLFPSAVPYGGSRMRTTPFVDYMGDVFSGAGVYNKTIRPPWQIQSALDKDLNKYLNWTAMGGPFRIYGDNMLGTTRANLSDPIMTSGFSVYGYLDKPTIPAQVFDPANIVIIYDGGCGSTCAIFAEFVKSQGGVRSIVVGGRAKNGPMQGVGGSKGAQVLRYLDIEIHRDALKDSLGVLSIAKKTAPSLPPAAFIPPDLLVDSPLGSKARLLKGARINLRSAIRADDTTQTPLQFVYEPANCRLFYTIDDMYDITYLWSRVFNTTWSGAPCVTGSTVNNANTMPDKASDTVAYSTSVNTAVKLADQPGLVAIGSGPGTGANVGIDAFTPSTVVAGSGTQKKNEGDRMIAGQAGMGLVALLVGAFVWL